MAKTPPTPGRSKIRVFFVDADLAAGDIQELTNALTHAIRPTHILQRVPTPRLPSDTGNGHVDLDGSEEVEFDEVVETDVGDDELSEARGTAKPRKYRSPKPVTTLDMNAGGKSFEEFAVEKGSPTEHLTRFLVAAQWLAEYAGFPTITVDHVFTCYKSADWTFDLKDPGFPFRKLKRDGLGDTKGGKFTINHLGTAKVKKMKPVPE